MDATSIHMHSRTSSPRLDLSTPSAFTILEVAVLVGIVAILVVLLLPNYPRLVARAQEAKCMANMRAIHVGLVGYLAEHKEVWPQGPPKADDGAWSDFWIQTLDPYGVTARTWRCPTIESLLAGDIGENQPQIGALHYLPTMFDAEPLTAKRLSTPPLNQPWLIEAVDAHGLGPLIGFGDGSIKSFQKVLAEQGVR